jgi:hypothetical protein
MRRVLVLLVAIFATLMAEGAAASGQGPLAAGASARVEISFAPIAGLPEGFTPSMVAAFKFRGEMDFPGHRGQLSFGSGGWDTIYDGDTSYSKMRMEQLIPEAKLWVRFDGASDGADPFDIQSQALELGPAQALPWLRGNSTYLREAGSEIVSGTGTTRYEGTLDLEKIIESAPAADREDLRWMLDTMGKDEGLSGTVPYTVWVDARGLIHRLRFVEGPMPFGMAVTVEFSDFGLPIVLDLPPAADVMGQDEFMQKMMAYADAHPSEGCGSDGTPTVTETTTDQGDGGDMTVLCFSSESQEGGK